MCGISAVIGKGSEEAIVKKSLSKIKHRGEKLFELKSFNDCVLGANRLAIVDRPHGKQPLSNETKTVFAVQNGEIYNYKELKKELESNGHMFRTDSDTEVLVHLWEEYNTKMLEKIDSEMYAFVIYDSKKNKVFVARDPLGVKPLYYAVDSKNRMHFASEIKQLSQFSFIKKIREFPAGHYYFNKKFTKYFEIKTSNEFSDEKQVKEKLKELTEKAVKKRVQTDLPIAVFLSGGVDSALLMELAVRNHPKVTAIILGFPGSSDFENAVKLCKEKNYSYKVVYPEINYEKELKELIYYLESFEPLIVRQAFANNIISREAKKLGFKIVLVGEAADELFAGYNEFSFLTEKNINKGCELLLKSLSNGHHMRVDKMAMKHTIETRSPFFDSELVDFALKIDGKLKIKKTNHRLTTKYIWRELAKEFVPEFIALRFKAPFANGAGMDIGFNFRAEDGVLAKLSHKHTTKKELKKIQKEFPEYNFTTREEAFYFNYYKKFLFDKFHEGRKRLVVKDNLIDLEQGTETRLLIAEFDKLAMYFPAYLASALGLYEKNGLSVDFIATGGDDKTYSSLIQNSAQIGMADPMFAFIDNPFAVKGEIIASLLISAPLYAVSFKEFKINSLKDFKGLNLGTFEEFSTTNTITKVMLPKVSVKSIHHSEIQQALISKEIDVVIVNSETAFELEALGAKIIYSFKERIPHFLFSGFTVAGTLEEKYRKELPKFLQALLESMNFIKVNPEKALSEFKKEFSLKQPKKTFKEYSGLWSSDLKINKIDLDNSLHYWRKLYPGLLHKINPFFLKQKHDLILHELKKGKISRSPPFREFELLELLKEKVKQGKPIPLIGFWGASDKKHADSNDFACIKNLAELNESIKSFFPLGIEFTFILSDMHAELNGFSKKNYAVYLKEIASLLKKHKFKSVYLSSLWKKHFISKQKILKVISSKSFHWKNSLLSQKLLIQAEKHHKLADPLKGAQVYFVARTLESKAITKQFSKHIFFAFSSSLFQPIYPNLPTLFFYSLKKGFSKAPWFLDSKN